MSTEVVRIPSHFGIVKKWRILVVYSPRRGTLGCDLSGRTQALIDNMVQTGSEVHELIAKHPDGLEEIIEVAGKVREVEGRRFSAVYFCGGGIDPIIQSLIRRAARAEVTLINCADTGSVLQRYLKWFVQETT